MPTEHRISDRPTSSQQDQDEESSGRSELSTVGDLPEINPSDFDVQRILGQGAFSDVLEVTFRSNARQRDVLREQTSSFSSSQCNSYALKCSKFNDIVSPEMINEASILSKLDHTNVIKAIGVSRLPPMLLLELLECTLQERIEYWKEEQKKSINFARRLLFCREQRRIAANEFQIRTQRTVYGIVQGLGYLHSQNIIIRDLKPENIGFDSRGEVKLFDFEFACYVNDHFGPNCTNIKPIAGSLRYMPPESLSLAHFYIQRYQQQIRHRGESYCSYDSDDEEDVPSFCCSFSSDVYALGIVLWEIGTLQKAYRSVLASVKHQNPIRTFYKKVSLGGYRPNNRKIPNTQFRRLVEKCWHSRAPIRPTIPYILKEWLPKVYPGTTLLSPSPSLADNKQKTSTRSSSTEQTKILMNMPSVVDTSKMGMSCKSLTSKMPSSSSFFDDSNDIEKFAGLSSQ